MMPYQLRGMIHDDALDKNGNKSDIIDIKSGIVDIKSDIIDTKSDIGIKSDIIDTKSNVIGIKSDIIDIKSDIIDINRNIIDINSSTSRIIKKETLVYPAFNITQPKFINVENKILFYKFQGNIGRIGVPTKDELFGEIVTIREGTVLMPHDCGYRSNVSHMLEARSIRPRRWFHSLVLMIVPGGGTFQHFLDGTLPKVIQALNYIQKPGVKLLMEEIRDRIIYEILDKLGISRENIVTYKGIVGADCLIYTCVTPPLHPLLWQKARSLLGVPEKLATPKTKANIVIISRKGCRNCGRQLLNHSQLKSRLESKYPQSKVLEFQGPLNLSASISLFGSTSVVVGVHGGGL